MDLIKTENWFFFFFFFKAIVLHKASVPHISVYCFCFVEKCTCYKRATVQRGEGSNQRLYSTVANATTIYCGGKWGGGGGFHSMFAFRGGLFYSLIKGVGPLFDYLAVLKAWMDCSAIAWLDTLEIYSSSKSALFTHKYERRNDLQ